MTPYRTMTLANVAYTVLICVGLYAFAESNGVINHLHSMLSYWIAAQ